jgi:hypothetical protein
MDTGEEEQGRYATTVQFHQVLFLRLHLKYFENISRAVYIRYNHIFSGILVSEGMDGDCRCMQEKYKVVQISPVLICV